MKIFGGARPDHPMAQAKEAQRILEALPADDPRKALEELAHWHESVATTEGFKPVDRIELLLMIDEAAQPRLRRVARDYFGAARPSRFQEKQLWTSVHGYWRQAGLAFARAVDLFVQNAKGVEAARGRLSLLLVRTLRSVAQQIKWLHLRYGPIDPAAWGIFNRVYAFSEARQLARASVTPYSGIAGETTPQLEFLKGLMFSATSPDSLLPHEVELVERLILEAAPRFVLASSPGAEHTYWTDLAQPAPPARLTRPPQAAPGLRCFGAGSALAELNAAIERVHATREVPQSLAMGDSHDAEAVLEVLRHVAAYWSPQPPERRSQRHAVKSRLAVAHGYEGVLEMLGGGDSLDFDHRGTESWLVENVSTGGFGALVPQLKGDWLRVGALVAMQADGGDNWLVGLVRRVTKTSSQQARVGIETLSKAPRLLRFAVSGAKSATEQGIVLKDGDASEARIVLRPGIYAPAQNLEAARGERRYVYVPQGMAERGEDYEIARFREMVREG
jgi:hypothetical protein